MDIDKEDYLVYKEYAATDRQREIMQACYDANGQNPAAVKLGCSRSTVKAAVKTCRDRAMKQGYIPEIGLYNGSPDETLPLKGASVYRRAKFDEQGNEVEPAHWAKFDRKQKETEDMLLEMLNTLKGDIKPCKVIKKPAKKKMSDLLDLYVLTDAHVGMLAWADETGDNWDLKIAKQTIVSSFKHLIESSPNSGTAFLCENGDYAHYDSHIAVTPMNKHNLDADGRPAKMIRVCIEIMVEVIGMLAEKYDKIHILASEGNHNIVSSIWMRELLDLYYSKNNRIEVVNHPRPYHAFEWGVNMLGFHHGHLAKGGRLADVFLNDYRDMYGRTEVLHIHTGHLHHRHLKETNTHITEVHPTLAAPDAHAARGGWRSDRAMQRITYHKKFKETGRAIVRPEMLL